MDIVLLLVYRSNKRLKMQIEQEIKESKKNQIGYGYLYHPGRHGLRTGLHLEHRQPTRHGITNGRQIEQ